MVRRTAPSKEILFYVEKEDYDNADDTDSLYMRRSPGAFLDDDRDNEEKELAEFKFVRFVKVRKTTEVVQL